MNEEGEEAGRWECSIEWEDGDGRVLLANCGGEEGEAVWGRFSKLFRGGEVG